MIVALMGWSVLWANYTKNSDKLHTRVSQRDILLNVLHLFYRAITIITNICQSVTRRKLQAPGTAEEH